MARYRTPIDALFLPDEEPTATQRLWASRFLFVWDVVNRSPAQAGKTWFWARVARFIIAEDPEVREHAGGA